MIGAKAVDRDHDERRCGAGAAGPADATRRIGPTSQPTDSFIISTP
jgi:hypothetical protein